MASGERERDRNRENSIDTYFAVLSSRDRLRPEDLGRYLHKKTSRLERPPARKGGKPTYAPDDSIYETAHQFVPFLSGICRVKRYDQNMKLYLWKESDNLYHLHQSMQSWTGQIMKGIN